METNSNKNLIIVGGSYGIGNSILKLLVNDYKIHVISRTKPKMEHANVTHYSCDVTRDELPTIPEVDALIYCPGSINLKPFSLLEIEDFKTDFEINVFGAIKVLKKYIKPLKSGKNPSVLLFSTVAVAMGMPYHTSIAASKAAIEGLVKSLAAEYAPHIRFNAIAPTVTNTNLASKLLRNSKMIETMENRHPLNKILQPEEVAEMASFLISEKASSISGQIIKLDNGIVTLKK
ncbi:MAG TPA: SDR family oxidoreductase [Flavobacteriaceae bacterium]|nr:SDR family oxidoreductase [Flavobacteriaceae bacterium]